MFVLSPKLRSLKTMLKTWNLSTFGDVNLRVSTTKDALDLVQAEISKLGPSEEQF